MLWFVRLSTVLFHFIDFLFNIYNNFYHKIYIISFCNNLLGVYLIWLINQLTLVISNLLYSINFVVFVSLKNINNNNFCFWKIDYPIFVSSIIMVIKWQFFLEKLTVGSYKVCVLVCCYTNYMFNQTVSTAILSSLTTFK